MPKSLHSDANEVLSAALASARMSANVSQVELAARLGVKQQFISKLETGRRGLAFLEFVAIARAIGVDPKVLFSTVIRKLPKSIEIA